MRERVTAGFVLWRGEGTWAGPDVEFFAKLSQARGDSVSADFFETYWRSDSYGTPPPYRRRTLGLFIAGTTLPTFAMALAMNGFGWIMPISPLASCRPVPPHDLVALFWR